MTSTVSGRSSGANTARIRPVQCTVVTGSPEPASTARVARALDRVGLSAEALRDQLLGALAPRSGRHSCSGRVPRGVGSGRGHHVARVEEHRDLQHREQQEHEQHRDQHELDDRGAAVAIAAHGQLLLETESIALLIASLICGSNTPMIATTRIADITVTITQPGTSPRSSVAIEQPLRTRRSGTRISSESPCLCRGQRASEVRVIRPG